jgi:DNA-binding response OmpR family regulator
MEQHGTVLLVDDDESKLDSLASVFRKAGWTVHAYYSAASSAEILADPLLKTIDLAILDHLLRGGQNGTEFGLRIKNASNGRILVPKQAFPPSLNVIKILASVYIF